ncbi:uroporphyrinogen-III synthase [Pseudoxanthomonas sp.]|uniref:uroporphyrinogen-III synthase n=1 Tax=Pseudoxanthomonas sp. TaxID=1871049 RepID=UPI002601E34C|nr:uroporphyrinogen-III synthase [Pseudoxanthomonas sp.]WDS34858.1 MAG: uroporphyrinogen-III synthase [Pseudoxanthomonas sp.]
MGLDKARAWYVISLRPQGEHAALRRAAARMQAGVIALSPWALAPRRDASTRNALQAALMADVVLFTSPAAVRFAATLQPLEARATQDWIATGAGTRLALHRAGIARAIAPTRMDSEGLLSLPALADLHGRTLGLITAPDGRGVLAPALEARGASVRLAEVYERLSITLPPAAVQHLEALVQPACVAITSSGALQQALQQLPPQAAQRLRACAAITASARLSALTKQEGFADVVQAQGPRPSQLMLAANAWFSHRIR